jgi:subtilase family serine protease
MSIRKKGFARLVCAVAVLLVLGVASSVFIAKVRAQQVTGRIAAEIDNSVRVTIAGTHPPMVRRAKDMGSVAPDMQLHGISIVFNRSAAQESALQVLIRAQQTPGSPLYHQWLTPDQFAARFGMTDSDLAKVESWLGQQGFSIDGVSRSHDRIRFSGTAGQVAAAFGTELHHYNLNGERHFAPAADLSIPAALAGVVVDVSNLSTLRPKPRFRKPQGNFTSSQTGHTFLTPADVATIYDVNPAYSAGYTGKGQSIAVVGQSSVNVADVENFQNALGQTVKDPTLVFVPGSGNVAESQGDELESDLDLEYTTGIAPGASIYFVYVGDNQNDSVWDSIQYAIDNDIAPIISDSYGLCEPALSPGQYASVNSVLARGAAQGQSIITPAGDTGSPDCEGVSGMTTTQQEQLAVDFPASSQYVTAMGGSEFPNSVVCDSAGCTPPAQYWQPANGADVISSALASGVPFPEQVWNDNAPPSGSNSAFLSSGGGGISSLTPRPIWQKQASLPPGTSSNLSTITTRMVPDISLSGSPNNAGYLLCSSDPSTGVTGSCSHGFRDVNTVNLTVRGGTSFDAPIFAGLVALINEKEKPVTAGNVGQGVVSPILYQIASTKYAADFHDIISGNNNCSAAGTTVCPGSGGSASSYSAGTGYDLASGLGSIDFNKLLADWPAGSPLTESMTSLSAATNAPAVGANDTITITVAASSGTPTGKVALLVDGTAPVSPLTLDGSGVANYTFVSSTSGSHVITATYSGDTKFAPSTSTLVVGNQTFRLTSTNPTIVAGSAGASTITITPQEGYSGTISWSVTSNPPFTNGCDSISNASVTGTTAVNASLMINTSSKACGGAAMLSLPGTAGTRTVASANSSRRGSSPFRGTALGLGVGGLVLAGVFVCRGKTRGAAGMFLVAALLLGVPACGGGSPSGGGGGGGGQVASGTYTFNVVGTDTTNSSISGSTTVTVTVN